MAPENTPELKASDRQPEDADEADERGESSTAPEIDGVKQEGHVIEADEDGGKASGDKRIWKSDLAEAISPVRELQAALRDQKEAEKRAFHELIAENVRLDRRLRAAEAKSQEFMAKFEARTVDLEAERAKSRQLENELAEMKHEMALLIKAARKAGLTGSGSRKAKDAEKQDPERSGVGVRSDEAPTKAADRAEWKKKLLDLEERLLRLTEEDERKSRRLISLERELLDKTRYIEALEQHVSDDVKQDLSGLRPKAPAPEVVFTTLGRANNIVYAGRPDVYSYKNNVVQDSAVCVVS